MNYLSTLIVILVASCLFLFVFMIVLYMLLAQSIKEQESIWIIINANMIGLLFQRRVIQKLFAVFLCQFFVFQIKWW